MLLEIIYIILSLSLKVCNSTTTQEHEIIDHKIDGSHQHQFLTTNFYVNIKRNNDSSLITFESCQLQRRFRVTSAFHAACLMSPSDRKFRKQI